MLPPAGDLAALPFQRVTGSGERGDGPPLSRGQLHPCPRPPAPPRSWQAVFPAAPALPGDNQALPQGKRSWQQEAEGRSAVEKEHAQPRQGAFPGPLTCCQGPDRTAPASILTRVEAGRQAHYRPPPLQSNLVPGSPDGPAQSRPSASPQPPPRAPACTH